MTRNIDAGTDCARILKRLRKGPANLYQLKRLGDYRTRISELRKKGYEIDGDMIAYTGKNGKTRHCKEYRLIAEPK